MPGRFRLFQRERSENGGAASVDQTEGIVPDEPTDEVPVVVGNLCQQLPGDAKAKAVAHVLRSIPIKIQAQDRIGNKRYRSIQIVDRPRTARQCVLEVRR